MVEVRITYETLFDLLRREKGRNELQELSPTFFVDVVSYLKEKTASLSESKSGLTSKAEHEKINIQIKNIKKILKELYELREKKIINLAVNKVKTGSSLVDVTKMLAEERQLFEETTILMSKFKKGILGQLSIMELPSIELGGYSKEIYEVPNVEESSEEESDENSNEEEPDSNYDSDEEVSDSSSEIIEPKKENLSSNVSPGNMKIKFLSNLPKFMGPDKIVYGPFTKEDVAEVPESVANLLLKKSRAQSV